MKIPVLTYDCVAAQALGVVSQPEERLRALGFTYRLSGPNPEARVWQFWLPRYENGASLPPPHLPGYLSVCELDPRDLIGEGLTEEQVGYLEDMAATEGRTGVPARGVGPGKMTPDQVGDWVVSEAGEVMLPTGFNSAIVGVVYHVYGDLDQGPAVIYDYWQMHSELMAQNPEMSFSDAQEFLDYNTIGSMAGLQVAVGNAVPLAPRMTAEELVEKMGGADGEAWDLTPAELAENILDCIYD